MDDRFAQFIWTGRPLCFGRPFFLLSLPAFRCAVRAAIACNARAKPKGAQKIDGRNENRDRWDQAHLSVAFAAAAVLYGYLAVDYIRPRCAGEGRLCVQFLGLSDEST